MRVERHRSTPVPRSTTIAALPSRVAAARVDRRAWIAALVGWLLFAGGVSAQEPDPRAQAGRDDDPFVEMDEDGVWEDDWGAPVTEPWVGWYGPVDEGLLDLKFGMGRFGVAQELRERDLQSRPAREGTQRFEGRILGELAQVVASYRPDASAPEGERLSAIQLVWTLYGVPNNAVDLFERLDGMLASRYGEPLLAEDDGYAALDSGFGVNRRYYVGTQARAWLRLEAVRTERYQLVLTLQSPQWHVVEDEDSR